MRLDKLLANMGFGSRRDVKAMLKKNVVTVDDKVIRQGHIHVNPDEDVIKVEDQIVHYQKYIYLMMNKPQGYISATKDAKEKTVIDLLSDSDKHFKPFPVGRLDKDTVGLLMITNDGQLAHQLTSPRKEVKKKYYAKIKGLVTKDDIETFSNGVLLDDGYKAKQADLKIINSDDESTVMVTITEGKYHQVKRMFRAIDKRVVFLKCVQMGELVLDDKLPLGSYRELNEGELSYCLSLKDE